MPSSDPGRAAGAASVLRGALSALLRSRAPEAAAGMAYYAFFSLFPLALLLVAVASHWLRSAEAQTRALDLIGQGFPLSRELVAENLRKVLAHRGSMGFIGVAGLVWSGTGFFTALVVNVNRAWQRPVGRGAVLSHLVGLLMTLAAVALLAASLLSSTVAGFVRELAPTVPGVAPLLSRLPDPTGGGFVPWLLSVVLLFGIYRWAPDRRVSWRAALPAAVAASFLLEASKHGFAWYVGSRLVRYELLYGGLGAIVVLLLWSYLGSLILLFGAHLSASIAHGRSGSDDGGTGDPAAPTTAG